MFNDKKILKEVESKIIKYNPNNSGNFVYLIPVVSRLQDNNLSVTLVNAESLEIYSQLTFDTGLLNIDVNGLKGFLDLPNVNGVADFVINQGLGTLTGELVLIDYKIYEKCFFHCEKLVDYDLFDEYYKIRTK